MDVSWCGVGLSGRSECGRVVGRRADLYSL